MRVYFHELAEAEFDKAIEYYENCRVGLVVEFAQEVSATIDRIIRYPEVWSPMSENTRRCLVIRFPFGVIYQVKSNSLRIIAIADLRRQSDYWLHRV